MLRQAAAFLLSNRESVVRTKALGPGQHVRGRFSSDFVDCANHLVRGDVMDSVANPAQDLQRAIRNRLSQLVLLFGWDDLVAISRHDRNGYREAAILWAQPARVRNHGNAVQGARADLPWPHGHSRRELSLETFRHPTGCEHRALSQGHREPTEQRRNGIAEDIA